MHDRSKITLLCVIYSMTLLSSVALGDEPPKADVLANDNAAFAVNLYQKLCTSDGNLFFSPYSISTVLAMTYAGARGNTETEMARALNFSLDQKDLHPAFAAIESKLNERQNAGDIKLNVANSLWPQQDYPFLDEYLALVKKHYGVSITPVDYQRACEAARKMINIWVEDKTQGKIKDLIQPGVLDVMTRLVLVNAIYFKGDWASQFKPDRTKDSPFRVSSQKSVQIPLMTQKQKFWYWENETAQILELPYVGDVSMMVLLPKDVDGLKGIERSLNADMLNRWKRQLRRREVSVFLPKFKMTSKFRLDNTLGEMGMVDAFSRSEANFAGMDGRSDWLYIGAVIHKAYIDVNEEGTEAAAATAVVMRMKGMSEPDPTFRADHPFIFLIHDNITGSILFIGRVCDPTQAGE